MTNVGRADGGARLTVADGVILRETCAGGSNEERRDSMGGGSESYLPTCGRSETEHDCGASAYQRTYYGETKTEHENT